MFCLGCTNSNWPMLKPPRARTQFALRNLGSSASLDLPLPLWGCPGTVIQKEWKRCRKPRRCTFLPLGRGSSPPAPFPSTDTSGLSEGQPEKVQPGARISPSPLFIHIPASSLTTSTSRVRMAPVLEIKEPKILEKGKCPTFWP